MISFGKEYKGHSAGDYLNTAVVGRSKDGDCVIFLPLAGRTMYGASMVTARDVLVIRDSTGAPLAYLQCTEGAAAMLETLERRAAQSVQLTKQPKQL